MTRRAVAQGKGLLGAALVGLVMLVAWAGLALPARLRIPRVAPHPPGTPTGALFSHDGHAFMACYVCHPSIFPQAPLAFSHREMQQGRYCGTCHNGVEATAIEKMACPECHAGP